MTERNDHQLLAEFEQKNSEPAFATLVERYVNLVYSTALRRIGNPHAAEEISQAVFIILAQKAGKLSARVVLSGWLYQTARLTAANFLRGEIRRQQREQKAYMQSTLNESGPEVWPQIAPLLDDALTKLSEADRNALVLRFFENKSLAEVGTALGASEDAAKMRITRALEKLRKLFGKRGVTLSAALIASAVSAGSVQAAPVGLAATISAVAITKGAAAGGSTLALVKGALKIMAWTNAKTAIVSGVVVLLAAGAIGVAVKGTIPKKTSAVPPVELKMQWQPGKTYAMRAERVQTLESQPAGRPQSFKQAVKLTQDYTLAIRKELDGGGRQLLLTFTDATMEVSQNNRKVSSFDSKQNVTQDARDPLAPMLRKLFGTRMLYLVNAQGWVEKMEGVEELLQQIGRIAKPQEQAMFRQLFSGDILKEYAASGEMLPDRPVTTGDHWQKTTEFVSPVGVVVSAMEYTFKNWEQHHDRKCIRIAVVGSTAAKPGAPTPPGGTRITQGTFTGDAWFDPELGMVVDASYDQNVTMETMNQGQPMTLQLAQKIHFALVSVE